jgi:hypothetical protein
MILAARFIRAHRCDGIDRNSELYSLRRQQEKPSAPASTEPVHSSGRNVRFIARPPHSLADRERRR